MRYAIAVLALVGGAASACEADVLNRFEALKLEAVRQFPEAAPELKKLRATFKDTPKGTDAINRLAKGQIEFNPRLCTYPKLHGYSVAAHEIGHTIASVIYSSESEDLANYYGAKLILTDRTELVDYFTQKCAKGSKDYCWLMASWQYGFTH